MLPSELKQIASDLGENPYYLAFALVNGLCSAAEAFHYFGNNTEYMIWNQRQWADFKKQNNLPRDYPTRGLVDQFTAFLAKQVQQ